MGTIITDAAWSGIVNNINLYLGSKKIAGVRNTWTDYLIRTKYCSQTKILNIFNQCYMFRLQEPSWGITLQKFKESIIKTGWITVKKNRQLWVLTILSSAKFGLVIFELATLEAESNTRKLQNIVFNYWHNKCIDYGKKSCFRTLQINGRLTLILRRSRTERYGSTLLPATREQHDQNCTQSH